MYRTLPYILLFAASVLFQVFLFDNLSISIYLNPLVYVAFILLLPMDTPPVAVLFAGLGMGMVMDCTMGAAGVNTIATLLIAFLRGWVIERLHVRGDLREGGVPSPARMGNRLFTSYLAIMVLIHHAVFFLLESLSWSHLPTTVLRIVLSSALTMAFVWIAARIVTSKLPVRI